FFVQTYPFQNLFFLDEAREVRKAVNLPLVLLGGICSIDHMETAMEEGFEFVAMGRALIEDPHLINKIKSGKARESKCDQCNKCIVEMDRGGVRCVLG
ncbi:MAG: NADH:flavin oxidoreductase, partial [Deltaproteobacteria bacterium]|nr:NADH:flavin oxidoreductase [Deltaproteobacteria bacterium]